MAAPMWNAQAFASQLDTLQDMLNEILLETAKTSMARRKSNSQDIRHVTDIINANTKAQHRTFQTTLSELIAEIQDAKIVCIRDYERIRARQGHHHPLTDAPTEETPPHDVQQQDVVSSGGGAFLAASSMALLPEHHPPPPAPDAAAVASQKPMAPFPDMDADLAPAIKIESPAMAKGMPPQAQAQAQAQAGGKLAVRSTPAGAGAASNFTKIQFTIVTPPSQSQSQPGSDAQAKPGRAETADMGASLEPMFLGEGLPNPQQGPLSDTFYGLGS